LELVEVDAGEPGERLLHDVFRFGGVTEHAPGEPEHPAAVVAPYGVEARVRVRSGLQGSSFRIHGSSAPRPTVVLLLSRRGSGPERDIAWPRHVSAACVVATGMHHNDTNPPAISVRGLSKTWAGGVEAVKGIDFDVATGEVFGLLGPNGAGKSTTIGMLTTTVVPSGGHARLAG